MFSSLLLKLQYHGRHRYLQTFTLAASSCSEPPLQRKNCSDQHREWLSTMARPFSKVCNNAKNI
jgi:hypothetical protein